MTQDQNENTYEENEHTYEYVEEVDEDKPPYKRNKKYVPSTTFIILLILIGLFVIYCRTILPNQLYDRAKKDYEQANKIIAENGDKQEAFDRYMEAYKIFNIFGMINPFDEDVIKYQVMTIKSMPPSYARSKRLYEIAQYDEDAEGEQLAREEVKRLRQEIMNKYGSNYIENVLFSNSVLRWNLLYKPLTFYVDNAEQTPAYYKQKINEAFSEWQSGTKDMITFKEIQSKDAADIVVTLSNSIPQAIEDYSRTYNAKVYKVGNTAPILKNDSLKQMVISIRTRNNENSYFNESEFANIIKHEIGHALGIWGHSNDYRDIMYRNADSVLQGVEKQISQRDFNTLTLLYNLYPDTINVPISPDEEDGLIYHYIVTKYYKYNSEHDIRVIMEELDANRTNISKWVELAIEYASEGRYEQSNIILFKALPLIQRDNNNIHVIYYNAALNYYNLRQYKDAENFINRAQRLKNDYDTRVLSAFIDYKLKDYGKAEKELTELFNQRPSDIEVALKLADIHRKMAKMDKAKEVINKLVKYNPNAKYDRRVLKYNIGKVYWGLASGM